MSMKQLLTISHCFHFEKYFVGSSFSEMFGNWKISSATGHWLQNAMRFVPFAFKKLHILNINFHAFSIFLNVLHLIELKS